MVNSVTSVSVLILDLYESVLKVLDKLPVLGRPSNLDNSKTRDNCACSRCALGGCLDILSLVYLFPVLSPSLRDGPI